MKFLSNAHTHTAYVDGRDSIPALVRRAQELGFFSLGFSEHGYQGFDLDYSLSPQRRQCYLNEIRALQKAHETLGIAPKLYAGVEQDALTSQAVKDQNRRDFDFIIGSAHYLSDAQDGKKEAVDGPRDMLTGFLNDVFSGDAVAMAKAYYALLGASVKADKPDIIGHFDVVRKHAAVIGLNTADKAYRRAALAALEEVFQGCRLMEVNTGSIARGYDTLPYPADFLLDAWREMGGELTLTSDCHNAADLDCAFAQTVPMLKEKGFKHLCRLGTGKPLWDIVEL
ncbi:MAG: hypothetical protein IH607_06425 [Firmicutes bacterium]|nr:hypothetical protein [Bacillota bacterium]